MRVACPPQRPCPSLTRSTGGGGGSRAFFFSALALTAALSGCVWLLHSASPPALATLHHLAVAAGLASRTASPSLTPSPSSSPSPSPGPTASTTATPSATLSPSATPLPPLRRHAVLLTGAIRDLIQCLPTTLNLFRATPGGLDVYAVLSPSAGGWRKSGDDAYGNATDTAALAWLRGLPARDPRVALQSLRVEEAMPDEALVGAPLALFPRFAAYPRVSNNPSINVLRDAYKAHVAWGDMLARCAEVAQGSASASPSPSPSPTAVNGSAITATEATSCYGYIVRARPDLCLSPEEDEAALPGGIDLDAWQRAGEEGWLGSAGGDTLVSERSGPITEGALAARTLYVPQLDTAQAACKIPDAGAGAGDTLPQKVTTHVFFTPDYGSDWGGPTDVFAWGPSSAMALFAQRAVTFDGLVKDHGVPLHPETLVRCGMLELARAASLGSGNGSSRSLHVVAHSQLKVSYCRRWGLQTTMCTGRGGCISVDNVTQGQACSAIAYHPMKQP